MKDLLEKLSDQPEHGRMLIEEILRSKNMGRECLSKPYLSPRQMEWLQENGLKPHWNNNLQEWEIGLS